MFGRTHTTAEIEEYRACWARPGVTRGMINWYRALLRTRLRDRPRSPSGPSPKVLVITGGDDPLFSRAVIRASLDRLPQAELVDSTASATPPTAWPPTASPRSSIPT